MCFNFVNLQFQHKKWEGDGMYHIHCITVDTKSAQFTKFAYIAFIEGIPYGL